MVSALAKARSRIERTIRSVALLARAHFEGSERFRRLALRATKPVLAAIEKDAGGLVRAVGLGGFAGAGGM